MQILDKIKKNYIIDTESIRYVESFLLSYPDLIEILNESIVEVRKIYPDARLHLEAYTHGFTEESVEIGILIETKMDIDDAMLKMVDLDNDWWLDVMPITKGKLFIDLYGLHNSRAIFCDDFCDDVDVSLYEVSEHNMCKKTPSKKKYFVDTQVKKRPRVEHVK